MYALLDIRRARMGVRGLVCGLENAVIGTLQHYGITAEGRRDAPGVYTDGRKIASVGLRVRRGCSYHGLALNVAMDLEPFRRINPCGFENLEVVQISDLGGPDDLLRVAGDLESRLVDEFGLRVIGRSGAYPAP